MEMEIDVEAEEEAHSFSFSQLLQLAEYHLRLRNYSLSSQYALEALHSDADSEDDDPLRHRVALIVAVSDVLFAASETLGSSTNWYSVLGVDIFCADVELIRSKFKSLLLLLEPVRAKYPLVNEAMKSAWDAWIVLSNPEKKSELDSKLSLGLAKESRGSRNGVEDSESFWTFCPYCYYMYEYAAVYEGYCLRCQNVSCRRAFHGVSIWSSPPIGLKQDEYFGCFGCFPLGFSQFKFGSWSPFVGMYPMPEVRVDAKSRQPGVDLDDLVNFVEISDGSDESEEPLRSGDKQAQFWNQGNGNIEVPPGVAPHRAAGQMMKRKSVGANDKKSMNRGRMSPVNEKVNLNDARTIRPNENEGNWYEDEVEWGFESAQPTGHADECDFDAEVEFIEKDGEIFVQLPSDDAF